MANPLVDFMNKPESKKPEAKKPDIKEEPKLTAQESGSTPLIITSGIDAYVHDRLKSQPKTLDEIKIRAVEPEPNTHQLTLPDDIQKLLDSQGYAPRWVNKDKRAIDRAIDIRGWTMVNRTLFPTISKHHFTANGIIERGDSILCFMPKERAQALRAVPGQKSMERVRNLPVYDLNDKSKPVDRDHHYKPDLTLEKDGEVLSGQTAERDFE